MKRWLQPAFLAVGLLLMAVGEYLGLFWAPPDRMMGEVQRIMYVHVPAAWMALVSYTVALVGAVALLWKKKAWGDPLTQAAVEVGVFYNALALMLGMLWGKPTWGAYWTWDARLTATLIMFLSFMGYVAFRRFVDAPEQRARQSAVYAVFAYASIPLVWFSVKWFRTLHQLQSSPATVDPQMTLVLRINAFAFLFMMVWFMWRRFDIARAAAAHDAPPPLDEKVGPKGQAVMP